MATGDNYEPTKQEIEFLNKVDQGYIGITKPKVVHTKFVSNLISKQQALEEDGDYLPIDAEGVDK